MQDDHIEWDLHLEGRWETTDYKFPAVPSSLSEDPAIYCWCVDGTPAYIGQADRLKRRIQHYRTPGPSQQTNLRMKAYLGEQQAAGKLVELKVLRSIRLDGQIVPGDALSKKWLRNLLEAWCVWRCKQEYQCDQNL